MARPPGRRAHGLSLAVQAAHLERRYPDGHIALRPNRLTWLCHLQPTELSRTYEVLTVIEPGWVPLVSVIDPPLRRRGEEPVPHVYGANDLCLYVGDEWNDTMIAADTIIPWTSEWLFFYETWHATGDWATAYTQTDGTLDSTGATYSTIARAADRLDSSPESSRPTDARRTSTRSPGPAEHDPPTGTDTHTSDNTQTRQHRAAHARNDVHRR